MNTSSDKRCHIFLEVWNQFHEKTFSLNLTLDRIERKENTLNPLWSVTTSPVASKIHSSGVSSHASRSLVRIIRKWLRSNIANSRTFSWLKMAWRVDDTVATSSDRFLSRSSSISIDKWKYLFLKSLGPTWRVEHYEALRCQGWQFSRVVLTLPHQFRRKVSWIEEPHVDKFVQTHWLVQEKHS